jgi:two-component system C4-dicarboxylate transport sensor histidine kinase DctB
MTTPAPPARTGPVTLEARELARINRLTTTARFVSGLAHELNNALQVMGGLVELLADRTDLPADAAVRIQKIGGQADRASGVIRQLLAFVREPGVDGGPVDLGVVVDRALALRRYQLGRAGVSVAWTRPQESYRVSGQERALEQVIVNLVVNAEEALEGQAERRLALTLARVAGRVQFSVSDSGHGVPAELRERIFDPFFTTRQSERAIGLGLTVGAAVAATHGGELTLGSSAPGSTTFVLDLPERSDSGRLQV